MLIHFLSLCPSVVSLVCIATRAMIPISQSNVKLFLGIPAYSFFLRPSFLVQASRSSMHRKKVGSVGKSNPHYWVAKPRGKLELKAKKDLFLFSRSDPIKSKSHSPYSYRLCSRWNSCLSSEWILLKSKEEKKTPHLALLPAPFPQKEVTSLPRGRGLLGFPALQSKRKQIESHQLLFFSFRDCIAIESSP